MKSSHSVTYNKVNQISDYCACIFKHETDFWSNWICVFFLFFLEPKMQNQGLLKAKSLCLIV